MAGYALFISVWDYEDGADFQRHESIDRSAQDLHALFRESELWTESTRLQDPAAPVEITNKVEEVAAKCDHDDLLFVYYCGHGEQKRARERAAELHLTVRTSEKGKGETQLALHRLYETLRNPEIKAKAKVLVLDCCNSGEVPPLGAADPVDTATKPDNVTCVLKPLRVGETHAHAKRAGDDYTAFSGALIDILSDGVPGASDPLTISDVFREMQARLRAGKHPQPDVIWRGIAELPLLENRKPGEKRVRDLLTESGMGRLAELWAEPRDDVPLVAIKHHVRGRLGDSGNACELVHHLHDRSPDLLGEAREMISAGPENVTGRTTRLLAARDCAPCGDFAEQLLERAIGRVEVPSLVEHHLAAGEPCPRLEQRFATAPVGTVADALADLRGRGEAEHAAGAVDRLIELFATRREHDDVRALLEALRENGAEFDASTVLVEVALGRPPVEVAAFVRQARDEDGREVSRLFVTRRRPREVAEFIAGFSGAAGSTMRNLLPSAVDGADSGWMIRLARALRVAGLADAPSAIVGAALHRGVPGERVGELLDGLTDCGPDQAAKIEGELREHLRHSATPVDELGLFLRRSAGPGRPSALVRDVVAARPLEDVRVLHRQALAAGDEQLAAGIAAAMAELHDPIGFLDFLRDFRSEEAHALLTRAAERRPGEDLGHLLSSWRNPENRPDSLRYEDDLLPNLVTKHLDPLRLFAARRFLVSLDRGEVLDPVVRRVLCEPQRFAAADLAALLVDLCAHSKRKAPDVVRRMVAALHEHHAGKPLEPVELAEIVAEVSASDGITAQCRRIVGDAIDDLVEARDDLALARTYQQALKTAGAAERAERFRQRIDP